MSVYSQPHQLEPPLPQRNLDKLVDRTRAVVEEALRLQNTLAPQSREVLREQVRAINSYYSNLIEGQGTHPRNIERALKADFSSRPEVAQRQRIALAHIEAERELEELAAREALNEAAVLHSSFLLQSHRSLYGRLSVGDRTTADGRVIEPGQLRSFDIDVGLHVPPAHASVPDFLRRMDEVYPRQRGLDSILYTFAAVHHRSAWVHPFGDGNGRACRLQTHCALLPLSGGLWSVSRALARQRDRYYALLANADAPRQGDLDGRGNLSERALHEWCEFFVEICLDQVQFMARMLELQGLRERIDALVAIRAADSRYANYRPEAVLPLYHVFVAGPVTRGEFCQMTGLGERTARRLLSQLLRDGLLRSEQPKGPVSIGLPLDSLGVLFPNLYPEAATANSDI